MNGAGLNLQSRGSRTISATVRAGISILNNGGMVACGFLGHKRVRFTVRSSRDSVKSMKSIAEHGNKFWEDCEERYFSKKLLNNTFE